MAAAAAALASAQAQSASVSAVAPSSSNVVASTSAFGGLGHPPAFLQHNSFFQKHHPSLAPPFVFPSGIVLVIVRIRFDNV